MAGQCTGTINITMPPTPLSTCAQRYAGADGIVQKSEAVQAVVDYFNGLITKTCAVEVVVAYFEWSGDPSVSLTPTPTPTHQCDTFVQNYTDFQIFMGAGKYCIIPAMYRNLPIWYGFNSVNDAINAIQNYFNTGIWT